MAEEIINSSVSELAPRSLSDSGIVLTPPTPVLRSADETTNHESFVSIPSYRSQPPRAPTQQHILGLLVEQSQSVIEEQTISDPEVGSMVLRLLFPWLLCRDSSLVCTNIA